MGLLGALLALSERKFPDFQTVLDTILAQVRKQMDEIMQAIADSSFGVAILQKVKHVANCVAKRRPFRPCGARSSVRSPQMWKMLSLAPQPIRWSN